MLKNKDEAYKELLNIVNNVKISVFEKHEKICDLIESESNYHIITKEKIEWNKEKNDYKLYLNIYFSEDYVNWYCIRRIESTIKIREICNIFFSAIKFNLHFNSKIIPPTPTDLKELIKIDNYDEFFDKFVYSKDWFKNQNI